MKIFACILSALGFLVMAVLYGVACWLTYGLWSIAVWVAMIAAIPLSSLLHELGHMLFGAMCKIKTKPRFTLLGASSCQLMPKTDKHIKTRVIITAYGGIVVNALIALGLISLIAANSALAWLSFIVPANIYLMILNSMPVHFSTGKTDGLVINGLIDNDDESKVMLAVLTVQAQILNGKPIEEVDESLLFDLPQIREDDQSFIALTELRYEYMNAKGETEKAELYKQRFEELKKEYA